MVLPMRNDDVDRDGTRLDSISLFTTQINFTTAAISIVTTPNMQDIGHPQIL